LKLFSNKKARRLRMTSSKLNKKQEGRRTRREEKREQKSKRDFDKYTYLKIIY